MLCRDKAEAALSVWLPQINWGTTLERGEPNTRAGVPLLCHRFRPDQLKLTDFCIVSEYLPCGLVIGMKVGAPLAVMCFALIHSGLGQCNVVLGDDVGEFTPLPSFHLLAHGFEVSLHSVDADRNAINKGKRLRMFGEHRRKRTRNNVANLERWSGLFNVHRKTKLHVVDSSAAVMVQEQSTWHRPWSCYRDCFGAKTPGLPVDTIAPKTFLGRGLGSTCTSATIFKPLPHQTSQIYRVGFLSV